jgi:glycosyltransferase involved in cell wall biosynthesis
MVLCSVIVPSLNYGRFIGETLESVLSQENRGLRVQVLVMDGGSTDDTARVVAPFLKSGRVTLVSEPDRGQSHAINKGLQRAEGELVTWLCSDDVYEPMALVRLAEALTGPLQAVLAYGPVLKMDEHGRIFGVEPALRAPSFDDLLNTYTYVHQPGSLLVTRRVREAGLLDESLHYAMDLEFWLRILKGHRGVALPERPVARARYHRSSKTISAAAAMADETMRVRWRHGAPLVGAASFQYARWRFFSLPLMPWMARLRKRLDPGAVGDPDA